MKQVLNHLRYTVGALAVLGSSLAFAQVQPASAAHHAAVAHEAQHSAAKKAHKHGHEHKHKHKHAHKHGDQVTGKAGEDQLNEYQRNALRRCAIFKSDEERRACVERVRQPHQISGSVEGGGVLREYTQTIHVAPHEPPAARVPGQVPPTQHLLHPPVQPIR